MKIEKISDNQIRCILTKSDLASRAIKLSELAYGSEKTKSLFRDMMRQAQIELDFHAEDLPLMIEAIPYSEHVVLIITKVEDPEELDTKFSNFAPGLHDESGMIDDMLQDLNGAAEVLDLFRKIQDTVLGASEGHGKTAGDSGKLTGASANLSDSTAQEEEASEEDGQLTCMFTFSTLAHLSKLARLAGSRYSGTNTLYKDEDYGTYILTVTRGEHSREEYNRFCNMASEYGDMTKSLPAMERYLEEHFTPIIEGNALQTLAEI